MSCLLVIEKYALIFSGYFPLMGDLFEYEYEIHYEKRAILLVYMLHIITSQRHQSHSMSYPLYRILIVNYLYSVKILADGPG